MDFTYADYTRLIEHMKKMAPVVPLGRWDETLKSIILRHDIDFSIDLAQRLSLIEADARVCSSFFVLMSSPSYNPCAAANRKRLLSMADMGFEIGLHFDPTVYGDADDERLQHYADREAEMLADVVGRRVESISLHFPSVHGRFPILAGYRNAYDPRIFSDDCYLSDSLMAFRGKDPFEFVARAKDRTIQILLHPMHFSESARTYLQTIHASLGVWLDDFDHSFRANKTYAAQTVPSLRARILEKGRM